MDVQHNSTMTREKRLQRVEDAEKRKRYRVAHGLEEDDATSVATAQEKEVDDQSPVAVDVDSKGQGQDQGTYVDWEGNKKPVKKWLGIW